MCKWKFKNINVSEFEGYRIYFDEPKTLEKLYSDKEFKSRFVVHLVDEIEKFINIYKSSLLEYLDNQKA